MNILNRYVKFGAPALCSLALLVSTAAVGQTIKNSNTNTAIQTPLAKKLIPQTTCPITGNPIDKNLFVDYIGKRIYVSCKECIAQVKKNPKKYIRKLKSMGQSVEIIGHTAQKDAAVKVTAKNCLGEMKMANPGYWVCPMDTQIHATGPGNCPMCGMKLIFKKIPCDVSCDTKGKDSSTRKK